MIALRPTPLPPAPLDRILWAVLGLGALGTVGSLVRFWGIRTEYADRFLVILGAAWAACQLLPNALAVPVRPRPFLALPLLLAGGVIVPFGWFLQVQSTGGRAAILWFQGGGLLLLTAATILARYGVERLRVMWFPLVFATFALPIPSLIYAPLQIQLQNVMTTLAEKTLPLLGIPVLQRDGFVLRLASGDLGVAAACSGVQSMTALTALAAFIGYLRGFGPVRIVLLEIVTIPIVATVNGVRVVASGVIQENFGVEYILDEWHQALGLAMIFLGLGCIALAARLMGGKTQAAVDRENENPTPWYEALGLAMHYVGLGSIVHAAKVVGGKKEDPTPQPPPRGGEGDILQPSPLEGEGGAQHRVRGSGFSFPPHPQPLSPMGRGEPERNPSLRPEAGRHSPSRGEGDNQEPLPSKADGERSKPGGVPKSARLGRAFSFAAVLLAATLTGLAIVKGVTAEAKFVAKAPLDELPLTLGEGRERWEGKSMDVPKFVTELLGQDVGIFREYENNTGQRVYVWVLFWSTAEMVKGYHHPDVCWGNKGYVSTDKRVETVSPGCGGTIPATVREFAKDENGGKLKQFVVYWTQEGRRVWNERDELSAQAGGFFFDPKLWFGDYQRESTVATNGRIVVLLATPSTDPAPKADALKFAKVLSDQLYKICPWAGPPHPSDR